MKSLHRGILDFLRSWPYAHPSDAPAARSTAHFHVISS